MHTETRPEADQVGADQTWPQRLCQQHRAAETSMRALTALHSHWSQYGNDTWRVSFWTWHLHAIVTWLVLHGTKCVANSSSIGSLFTHGSLLDVLARKKSQPWIPMSTTALTGR
jgi:hypothetical protein